MWGEPRALGEGHCGIPIQHPKREESEVEEQSPGWPLSPRTPEEAHRLQFRSGTAQPGEAPWEMLARLSRAAQLWLRPGERTKEQIVDVVVREQFLGALRADVRAWVTARKPRSSEEAAVLAEACLGQGESTQPAQVADTARGGEIVREWSQTWG
uniref:SCAN box domain-containing protein n=1 Tax=Gopherus evgoodei TaxID=1825980 RepID=A0A8C4YB93_9SAUR